jgi:hypothetical protein
MKPGKEVAGGKFRNEEGVQRKISLYVHIFDVTNTVLLILLNRGQAATGC